MRNLRAFSSYKRFTLKDTYHPSELVKAYNPFEKKTTASDPFALMNSDPLKEYKNVTLLSRFVTDMGMIKHRKETGLLPQNQVKLARAIKRARQLGLMPYTSRPAGPKMLVRS